jgi:hypothetical protein
VIFTVRIASVLPSRSMFRRTWIQDSCSAILDPRSIVRHQIISTKSFCKIQFSSQNPFVRSDFPCSKFDFLQWLPHFREIRENLLQWLSNFFNGFPISSTAFRFLKWLSDFFNGFPIFLNGFPLSEKSGKIYLWRQIYERSLSELRISRSKSQYSAIKYLAVGIQKIGGWNTNNRYQSFVFSASSFVILTN